MEKKTKSFVEGAAILAVAGLIVKAIGAVYRIPLTNMIGTQGMAFYEVAYPYYSWLLVISSQGLPTAISKMVSERVSRGDYHGAEKVYNLAYKLLFIIGIVTSLVMFLLSGPLANMSSLSEAKYSFMALAPALLFVSLMCAYRGYLQGMQYMIGTAVSQVTEQVFKLVVGFALAGYFIKIMPQRPEFAAMGALIGVTVSELLALIVIRLIYGKHRQKAITPNLKLNPTTKSESSKSILKSLVMLALPITIGASIMPLTGIIDSALIMNILQSIGIHEDTAQSMYAILRSNVAVLINMPAVLTSALAMSLVPAISSAVSKQDRRSVKGASRTGLKLATIIGMPCAVGLYVLAKPILSLLFSNLSTDFQLNLAADLLRISAIGVMFLSVVQAMTGVLQGHGKPGVPVLHLAIGAGVKVVTMIIMMHVPKVNISGAAYSTVFCYAVAAILDVAYCIEVLKIKFNVMNTFIKPAVASVAMGLTAALTYKILGGTSRLHTIIAIGAAVVVYAVMVVVLKMFTERDLSLIPGGNKLAKIMYRKKGKLENGD